MSKSISSETLDWSLVDEIRLSNGYRIYRLPNGRFAIRDNAGEVYRRDTIQELLRFAPRRKVEVNSDTGESA